MAIMGSGRNTDVEISLYGLQSCEVYCTAADSPVGAAGAATELSW